MPTQLRRLLDAGADLSTYDGVLVGGAALAPSLHRAAVEAGVPVVTTYGMSETCGGCVYDGVPLDGVDVRLRDDGRVELGGPVVFAGYRLRPDLTAAALVDGRHVTQDLGRWTRRRAARGARPGRRRDRHRWRERARRDGGAGRSPGTPGVAACAVVGRPDAEWGERVVAVVQPVDWSSAPDARVAAGVRGRHARAGRAAPRWS